MGIPEVNQATGTLSQGETGLFVSLGGYSAQARAVERQRHDLRLLGAEEIVDLTLDHYVDLPPRWRSRIPLRQVFVVDRDAEGTRHRDIAPGEERDWASLNTDRAVLSKAALSDEIPVFRLGVPE